MKHPDNPNLDTLQTLIQDIGRDVLRGIQHGHFDYEITGSANANGKRNVIFKAGLTKRYQLEVSGLPKNLTPLATFYPMAQHSQDATPMTSAEDARVGMEHHDDKGNERP